MTKRNIVHIEIPTHNAKASGEFYGKLFGWHITHDEEMNYTMFDPHEGPGGGFSPIGDQVQPGDVVIYVHSDDIESDLNQAVALGATIAYPKTVIPNTGWFGMFKDPTGNVIALYTSMHPQ